MTRQEALAFRATLERDPTWRQRVCQGDAAALKEIEDISRALVESGGGYTREELRTLTPQGPGFVTQAGG